MAISREHARLSNEAHTQQVANIKRVYGPGTDYGAFMEREKRWLINDKADVRKIDSVYRNRDAGLARRGLKRLDKWWDEDDETLDEVMKGAVEPVCSRKRDIAGAVGPACSLQPELAKAGFATCHYVNNGLCIRCYRRYD
jgi:Zn ribbon nucleic-acid-binding protein